MNAVQTLNRVYFYMDVSRSARLYNYELDIAVNDAIEDFTQEMLGDVEHRSPVNFQWIQQVRDNLFTLIKTVTIVPSNGTAVTNQYFSAMPSAIINPVDYYEMVLLMCTIDGYTVYAHPTTYNQIGPLLQDSFRRPTNIKPYFNEIATGYTIWRENSGTFTGCDMTYIKAPTPFTIGAETQQINAGGTLTNALAYYALEISVYSGVTYQIGATITGSGAALTSGQVILASNTSPIALPDKVHDEIAKRAAVIALKNINAQDQAVMTQSQIIK